jgi:hypothetical protein
MFASFYFHSWGALEFTIIEALFLIKGCFVESCLENIMQEQEKNHDTPMKWVFPFEYKIYIHWLLTKVDNCRDWL